MGYTTFDSDATTERVLFFATFVHLVWGVGTILESDNSGSLVFLVAISERSGDWGGRFGGIVAEFPHGGVMLEVEI